ncbi:MAG: alpha-L-rhamnosidase C-terminal domain-containing protein [Pyrinomonadaceae bacterium]
MPKFVLHIVALLCFVGLFSIAGHTSAAERINPELLIKAWSARWITVPKVSPVEYGVYHFRRTFELGTRPSSFVIHVSGDNRYQLFVNGERVAAGPARSDLNHWKFETLDIAPLLRSGKNVLAAVVWNYGQLAPEAQLTNQTGFLLQGDTAAERVVDTNNSWKCVRNEAYSPLPVTHGEMRGYFVAGPGDRVDGERYPWNWQEIDFNDNPWATAQALSPGSPRDARDGPNRWMLVPRDIPFMEQRAERIRSVRQSSGVAVPAAFPREVSPFQVPPRTKARLLLDQTYLTTGYPELIVSGGKGSIISLGYAETLMRAGDYKGDWQKDHRDAVEGKRFVGYKDVFVADGGAQRLFRPLWWRTYRYLEFQIETQGEPLTIDDLRGVYTGYPFERKAVFDADSDELQKILDVGWRTARLCAHETYMDCPYYEQLQYAGDTRVQALVSLYMSGDDRLMRNAIAQLNDSRTAEGATYSRAPSRLQQYIPPFSLWWIGMVHDHWMYRDDPAFVRSMLPGVRAVISFFAAHQKPNGSLGRMPWWNFIDWAQSWENGVPPAAPDGSSAPGDLQLLLAYRWASEMEAALGSKSMSAEYARAEAQLRETIQKLYWDEQRKLYADTPQKQHFSQQTNALAALADVIQGEAARALIDRTIDDQSLVQCSIYFRHYLHSALNKVGGGDRYPDMLGTWRTMLASGLTTWAETADPSRSDCHAWGASPNYELFRTVAGIDSAAPGFKRVVIRPYLGKLTKVTGKIPHPQGEIAVTLNLQPSGKLEASVSLPAGVSGDFIWRGTKRALLSGTSKFTL